MFLKQRQTCKILTRNKRFLTVLPLNKTSQIILAQFWNPLIRLKRKIHEKELIDHEITALLFNSIACRFVASLASSDRVYASLSTTYTVKMKRQPLPTTSGYDGNSNCDGLRIPRGISTLKVTKNEGGREGDGSRVRNDTKVKAWGQRFYVRYGTLTGPSSPIFSAQISPWRTNPKSRP